MVARALPVVLAALLLLGCASVRPQIDPLHIAYIGTATTDTLTSIRAMEHGGVETSPIYGGAPPAAVLIGAKVAGWLVLRWVDSILPEDTPTGMRLLLWGIPIAIQTYGTIKNIKVGNKLSRREP